MVAIISSEAASQRADLEPPWADFSQRGHFGGTSGEERLLEPGEFLRPDRPLDDLDPALRRERHHRAAGDAIEETIGRRSMENAIL